MCFFQHGDVAQPGERLVRNEEVTGSSPVISTICFWRTLGSFLVSLCREFSLAKAFLVWYPERQEVFGHSQDSITRDCWFPGWAWSRSPRD